MGVHIYLEGGGHHESTPGSTCFILDHVVLSWSILDHGVLSWIMLFYPGPWFPCSRSDGHIIYDHLVNGHPVNDHLGNDYPINDMRLSRAHLEAVMIEPYRCHDVESTVGAGGGGRGGGHHDGVLSWIVLCYSGSCVLPPWMMPLVLGHNFYPGL